MVLKKKKISSQSDDEINISFDEEDDDSSSDDKEDLNTLLDAVKESEDSDSAPEEVCFKDEEEKTKLMKKRTREQLKVRKQEIKKKRTEIHARNVKQKEERQLRSRELPAEILESLDVTEVKEPSIAPLSVENTVSNSVIDDKPKFSESEKFVGIYGPTVFKVKNLKKDLEKPVPVSNDISSFRNRMLYGKKIRREKSTSDYFAKLDKQKIRCKQ